MAAKPTGPSTIGVICSGRLAAHRDEIKTILRHLSYDNLDATWLCLKDRRADNLTQDLLLSLDIEPEVVDSPWKLELLNRSDECIVFVPKSSKLNDWKQRKAWSDKNYVVWPQLKLVEL